MIPGESLKGKLVQGEQDEQRLEENAEAAADSCSDQGKKNREACRPDSVQQIC